MTTASHRVSVREHAVLGTDALAPSLDAAQVSESAFDYLCRLSEALSKNGARLVQVGGRRRLKLDSYVGVIQTPCGTLIEIVPKHVPHDGDLGRARALLRRMLLARLKVDPREVGPAAVQLFDGPLTEWVMRRFLDELDVLVTRGLRFDYQRIEDRLPFLRGQLDVDAQLRQPPGREHLFNVRHDVYLPERPENRLLRLALEHVRRATQDPDSWRLAQELTFFLTEIPASRQVAADFRAWSRDRLLAHYRRVKPWCELILNQQMPLALAGAHEGLSLLYPMEELFECFVVRWLRRQLKPTVDIRTPAKSESLCQHLDRPIFQLEPDVLVSGPTKRWVLDAKWKLLDAADRQDKYGLSQSDFYQLYAYGQKYLGGAGRMALVYPRTRDFPHPLAPFDFGKGLTLEVLPFDLEEERLLGGALLDLPLKLTSQLSTTDMAHVA